MKFETVLGRWQREELSQVEAAEILGVTERPFRRWYQSYEEDGLDGLLDRRLGKPSAKRVPDAWMARLEQLYRRIGQAGARQILFRRVGENRRAPYFCYLLARQLIYLHGLFVRSRRRADLCEPAPHAG